MTNFTFVTLSFYIVSYQLLFYLTVQINPM